MGGDSGIAELGGMSGDRAPYLDAPKHLPLVGPIWEAFLRTAAAGGAKSPYENFHAGYCAGLPVCTRPCCQQQRLDLEPAT